MVRAKGRRCDAMARADAGERSQGDPREIPGRDPRCLFAKFRWTKRDGPAGCVCAVRSVLLPCRAAVAAALPAGIGGENGASVTH